MKNHQGGDMNKRKWLHHALNVAILIEALMIGFMLSILMEGVWN